MCSARPSAAMYSTSKRAALQIVAEEMRARLVSSPGGLTVGIRTRSAVNWTISSAARSTSERTRSMGCMDDGVYNIAIMRRHRDARRGSSLPRRPCASLLRTADLKVRTTACGACSRRAGLRSLPANATLTAVPGIKVGHHTLTERPTGCTVVLIEAGATAGVDVRGAAPATRDTDLLNPTKMVEQIYGIALSGGSLFGLSTRRRRAALSRREEHRHRLRRPPHSDRAGRLDLRPRRRRRAIRPTADCGYRAAQAATARRSSKAASAPAPARRSASSAAWSAR